MYARGHIPDHPAVVAKRTGLHLHPEYGAMRAGTVPLTTSNRALLPRDKGGPGIWNQFDVGACEGCGNGSAATIQMALDGTPLSEPISPVGNYLQALMTDASPNPDGTLPWLIDTGTMPSSVLAGWLLYGGSPASVWGQLPMGSGTMYSKDATAPQGALIQPSPNQLYGSRQCRLNGAYFLTTSGTTLLRDIVRVLAAKKVMTNAIPASGSQFQSYTGGVLGALSGDIDHCSFVLDYEWVGTQAQLDSFMAGDDSNVAMLVLHCCNSWGGIGCPDGGDWGEVDSINQLGGQYRADANYAQQAQDWCVLSLTRVS